jgi:hypothetical protein
MIDDSNEKGKPVLRYEEKRDEKGHYIWKPVYLRDTPSETIDMMNEKNQEWKTTKQLIYDTDGHRIEE